MAITLNQLPIIHRQSKNTRRHSAIDPNLTFLYVTIGHNYRTLAFLGTSPAQQSALYNDARANYAKGIAIDNQLKNTDPFDQ